MIIYSNSCSYGATSDGPVYSEFVAKHFDARLINHGLPGCCNERIFRTSTRDILKIVNNNNPNDVLVLIGLTNTFRGEHWGSTPAKHADGHFQSFTSSTQAGFAKNFQQEFYKLYDQEAAITNLLSHLVMFVSFLKNVNVKYLIWTNTPDLKSIDVTMDFVEPFYKHINKDKNILPLFDFNFCNYAQSAGHQTIDRPYDQGGHPDTNAHEYFSKFLISSLKPHRLDTSSQEH